MSGERKRDASLWAFPDGVTWIVWLEVPSLGHKWCVEGIPGGNEIEAIDWVIEHMRQEGMKIEAGGLVAD